MTTSIPHTHIRQRHLSQLFAGLPYIVGFPPTDSLVLFTFRRCPLLTISSTIRMDLPEPEHFPIVVAELAAAVAMNDAVAVIAVVVSSTGPRYRLFIDLFRKALNHKDILLSHASWVPKIADGEQWQCYDDPLCNGLVPDPQTTALGAARAVAGELTYPDREAMAAQLAPDSQEALARRRKLLEAYRSYTEEERWADLEFLGHVLDIAKNSYDPPTLTDHQLVRLARALAQTPIKDECLAMVLSDEPEPAERLWTVLVRALPAPERAAPALLLAMSAYLRGAGVIAGLALQVVLESVPEHELATRLDAALQMGFPPDRMRALLVQSIIKNNEDPADDDPPWDTTEELSQPESKSPEETTEQPNRGEEVEDTAEAMPVAGSHEAAGSATSSVAPTAVGEGMAAPGQAAATAPPRVAPGPLSQQAAIALGIPVDAPVRTVTMDPLTAFLPPPTERSGPG